MFMDGSDQLMPGRSGSLVVTLPNNAANREPRVILQFIQLATRMAYSALAGAAKPHKGVTLDKFRSFDVVQPKDVEDATCAICFDPYLPKTDPVTDGTTDSEGQADTERPVKKRKIAPGHSQTAATTSAAREEPETAASATDSTSASASDPGPKYLCQLNEEYPHVPLRIPCGHVFGQSCLAEWLRENTSCPLCRVSVADEEPEAPSIIPISYIRLGGLGANGGDAESTAFAESLDIALPGTSRARVSNGLAYREAPPSPLPPRSTSRSSRNSSVAPMIDSILGYFSRARRQREAEERASPIFATGVASRRTQDGVDTVSSDAMSSADSFEHLTSLLGDLANRRETAGVSSTEPTTELATEPTANPTMEPAATESGSGSSDSPAHEDNEPAA